jgi:hypothetical protein
LSVVPTEGSDGSVGRTEGSVVLVSVTGAVMAATALETVVATLPSV